MTKKQLKKLAKDLAGLERTIQSSTDAQVIYESKEKMTRLTESAQLTLEEMLQVDELIQNYLQS